MTWSGRERRQIAWWIRLLLVQLLLEQGLAFLDLEEDLPSSATTRTSRRQPQSRIVGGVETPPGLYPGFVYWDQGCGATLIHEDIVLSAAHCFNGNLGTLFFNSTVRREGYMGYPELVKIHPNYNQNREDPDWDFLILKLSEPIPPEVATPVILNRDATVPNQVAQALLTVGFGRTEEGGKSDSKTLQHVLIPYVPNDMCQQNYGTDKIGPAMLCAGKGGSDACQGDSGGPIFLNDQRTQVGITSWGMGCARAGFPGVYARISTGFPWIQAQICLQSANPPTGFCSDASVPIPLSLELSANLDEDNWENFTFGLYAIDSLTTLIRWPQQTSNRFSEMVPPPSIQIDTSPTTSTKASTTYIRRKREDKQQLQPVQYDKAAAARTIPPNVIQENWTNVTAGTYYFQIRNPVGLGFTSPNSHAWLTQGGGQRTLIDVPKDFGTYWDAYITINQFMSVSDIRQSEPNPVSQETVAFTIDFFYDNKPQETSWELRNANTSSIVAYVPSVNVTLSQFVSYTYDVPRGYSYQLHLWDTGGNGLANGWVNVWLGNIMVWSLGDGKDYEYEYVATIHVP